MAAQASPPVQRYDVDMNAPDFDVILGHTLFIIQDNPGMMHYLVTHQETIMRGGMKNSRVYRMLMSRAFLQNKTAVQRAGFLVVLAAAAFVQRKSRVSRVVASLPNSVTKTAATVVLNSFFDTRGQNGANDVNTFMIVNLRAAFPELVTLIRIVLMRAEAPMAWALNPGTPAAVAENWAAWMHSGAVAQLNLDATGKDMYRNWSEYYWTSIVTGAGAGWKPDSNAWYDRTARTDYYRMPDFLGVTINLSGADAAGTANTRYTLADLQTYATAVQTAAVVPNALGVAPAAGQPFG